jgi:DNA-binding NarL/FixJ family response regulator
MPINVLLADDSEVVRRGIRKILEECPDIEVVGEADDLAGTVQMVKDLKPQVILMDLHMKGDERIKPENLKSQVDRRSRIVAISFWTDEETRALAESFGAVAFLDKVRLGDDLVPTIRHLASASANPTASL